MVYHIEDPCFPGSTDHGYVGVVKASKGVEKRFAEHRKRKSYMRPIIREQKLTFEQHVHVIFEGVIDECYLLERKLRPIQRIGWNVASGGGGANYKSEINDLKLFRSIHQTTRMQDALLKQRQAAAFKERYYNDEQSQALRKQKAREHMSNSSKRDACLTAMHRLKKCPLCDYTNNAGNVAIHMKKAHS